MIKELNDNKRKIVLSLLGIILVNVVFSFFRANNEPVEEVLTFSFTLTGYLLSAFFSPFFEETLMRGIFQNYLMKKKWLNNLWISIVLSSVFALLHLDLFFLPYFITGLILSNLFIKTNGSLLSNIVVHSLYNNFVFIIFFLIKYLS
ncbi:MULTISPECIES: CPBP family intramembrane glutamic endopeptidase [Vagococcus]|uniref:CAAX prenyl protease 2/Lysostaphin resistance protein A-like domain-containing protein n=1 Tax=Vagococcus fluvialis bH819 TaxID=1255619 RepID=A0A1X6WS35_9ENTE|nr:MULTISPECIES: CPBP family intramembrane glutamic endopeptidase [Vagococcus]SLM87095.1 hypothetical protein FM121_13435 [Vagococcus fluvialis bH819]